MELIGRREGTRYFVCEKCEGITIIKDEGKRVDYRKAPTIMGRPIPLISGPSDVQVEDEDSE